MILIDTDVFVIDRRYPRDVKFQVNRKFLDYLTWTSQNQKVESRFMLLQLYNTQDLLIALKNILPEMSKILLLSY